MTVVVTADYAYVNGGAGKIALESAKALAQRGHRVILFSAVGPIADDLRDVPNLTHVFLDQQDVWNDPDRMRAAIHSIWNRTAAARMAAVLAELDPADTVVHVHSWTKALSTSVVRTARSRGFKVILTLHDFLSVCPIGTFFNHSTGRCCELRPLSRECIATNCDSRSYKHKLWRVGRQVVQRSIGQLPAPGGHFIAVSQTSGKMLGEFLPDGAHMHHVENFTDVPQLEPAAVDQNDSVVYVGRLSPEKGPTLLADSLQRLGVRGVFVGSGDLAAAVLERNPSAEITGWLSPEEVRERMRQARVLALPSPWFETQGLVVAEAASVGVPSIVPDTSGARDWVENGKTGLWFRGNDIDDLSAKIKMVMDDPAWAARMGRAAYDRFWSSPPTLDRHVRQLEAAYGAMLATAT